MDDQEKQDNITIGSGDTSSVIDISGLTVGGFGSSDLSTCYSISNNMNYTGSSYSGTTLSWSSNYSYDPAVNITSDGITMKEGSDIKVGDKSLLESIEKIEERLAILHPNPELEDRWDQLKSLRQQYIDLEKELIEKEKMWEILKKS
jgi:hypothetical protein